MKTRQMSLLKVLSVMVLLLFAAPMMDGVLTLFQSQHLGETTFHLGETTFHLGETTFFETSVYAHPPSVDKRHTHDLKSWWEKCKDCGSKIKKIVKIAVWVGVVIYGEGGAQVAVEAERRADEQVTRETKECAVEVCPPPPGDGGNDGGNDS